MRMSIVAMLLLLAGCGDELTDDELGMTQEAVVEPGKHNNGNHYGHAYAWGHRDRGTTASTEDPPSGPPLDPPPEDPPPTSVCGDGACTPEEVHVCALDCGPSLEPSTGEETSSSCGDGFCSLEEQCDVCLADCGPCARCGDGVCQVDAIDAEPETVDTCPQDCS